MSVLHKESRAMASFQSSVCRTAARVGRQGVSVKGHKIVTFLFNPVHIYLKVNCVQWGSL